jgi:hypothetical protein
MCLILLLVATTCVGCKGSASHQGPLCDKLFAHDERHWEFAFYGHHPTCWQAWPADWMGCPTHGPFMLLDQSVEVLPGFPPTVPPAASAPGEIQSAPGLLPAPSPPPPSAVPQASENQGASRLPLRLQGQENRSSVQLIRMSPSDHRREPHPPAGAVQQHVAPLVPLPPIRPPLPERRAPNSPHGMAPKSLPEILGQGTVPIPSGHVHAAESQMPVFQGRPS